MDAKYLKAAFRIFLILVVLALLGQAILGGFYWYKRKSFGKSGKYFEEKERCERVLNGEEGNITDYSYCKNYLEWLNKNISIDD